jgi:hypothetical protein
MLVGHAHYERFKLLVDAGTSDRRARLCAVTLLSHKCAMPGQDGVRRRNRCDLLQGLSAQCVANLSQSLPLSVGQQQPSCLPLVAQDAVSRREIRMAQSEYLINRACDRCS